jgi:hypothetical protein
VLARVTALEATVAQLLAQLPSTPGIGHNNPPPLLRTELEEINSDVAPLKEQAPAPREGNKVAKKLATFAAYLADKLIDVGIKEGGKAVVTASIGAYVWRARRTCMSACVYGCRSVYPRDKSSAR